MIYLKTDDKEVFHESEEILRFFVGMDQVRMYSECSDDASETIIQVDLKRKDDIWFAESRSNKTEVIYKGECRILSHDKWGIKRSKGRAVKFSLFKLLKYLYPDVATPWGCLTGIRPTKILYELLEDMPSETVKSVLLNEYGITIDRIDLLFEVLHAQSGYRNKLPNDYLDIYLGIPFCPTRCDYCSFASNAVKKYGYLRDAYLRSLLNEATIIHDYLLNKSLKVGTLYIGGGTPTALDLKQMEQLFKISELFKPESLEFTLEAGRPDTIDREKLILAKDSGVNRISINPQTMHNDILRIIGREHTVEEIKKAFYLAREIGFNWINMDLIAGLPGENGDMFSETIEETMSLDPENITIHTLSIKRSSKMRDVLKVKARLDGFDVCDIVDEARKTLIHNGWNPYYLYRQKYMSQNLENVGYSKKGFQCLYNINVMEETHSNIALGAGAITKWFNPETNVIKRSPNVKDLIEYIKRSEEMARKSIDVADLIFNNTLHSISNES